MKFRPCSVCDDDAVDGARISTRAEPRWCHADVWLRDFAIVTWAVEPSRLASLLPAGFTPDVRDSCVITSGQLPSSAGLQRDIHFDVYTPPVRV